MLKYIVKRLLMMIPVILGITLLVFGIMALAPGDPAQLIVGIEASFEQLEAKRHELGLDQPFLVRYGNYIINILHGDFGKSWLTGRDILKEFFIRLPNTLIVGLLSLAICSIFGIILGVIAAIRQHHIIDYTSLAIALIFSSLPAFWTGLLAQIVFALNLHWFPASGSGSILHYILPSFTLGAVSLGGMVRLTRSSMLDVIGQDYVRTARAKGATETQVIWGHVMRNGLMPVVTTIGNHFAHLFAGAVITETVFGIGGIGTYMVNAVKGRDIPVVMGCLVFIAISVSIVNLLIDLIYVAIDPRVKLN
ncbi:peptide ABC transporter permease [Spirochaetia bacterium]|nr:peptide ABC transporter permease [Spirochaetia bacterium]